MELKYNGEDTILVKNGQKVTISPSEIKNIKVSTDTDNYYISEKELVEEYSIVQDKGIEFTIEQDNNPIIDIAMFCDSSLTYEDARIKAGVGKASRILKFEIDKHGETEIKCKEGSIIVDFQHKTGKYFVWVLEGTGSRKAVFDCRIVATGETFDITEWAYIKTIHVGEYVWHLIRKYEILED